ncbi:hypothetical protein SDJN03_12899, partial [Cucurbita argyrosperma subsp. sororia]
AGHTGLVSPLCSYVISDWVARRIVRKPLVLASPSHAIDVVKKGHFARECTSSAKVDKKQGLLSRECTISAKGGKKNREDASGAASPNPCYRCGEDGHFSRGVPKFHQDVVEKGIFCPRVHKFHQGGKRNRELSNHKSRSKTEETYHMGSKSAPHNLAKAHSKKKKINYDEKYTNPA